MRQKKLYKIVATTTYRGQEPRNYVVEKDLTKREAEKYLQERCYTTVTRTFTIEEQ